MHPPWEVLHLPTDASASIANGVVSIVGVNVWLGNGVNAQQIGAVDAILDGTAGKVLRVNFSSTFQNPGFETADMSSWTALNQRIDLGVTSIAGCPTIDTTPIREITRAQDNKVPARPGQLLDRGRLDVPLIRRLFVAVAVHEHHDCRRL